MAKRTEDETQKAFIALALCNGSTGSAAEVLQDEGLDFTSEQLTRLKNTRPREYWEHRETRMKIVRARMGEAAGRMADRRAEMIERVLDRIDACLDSADLKDLVGILRALDGGYASSVKAMGDLVGQPAQRVEVNHTGEIVARLQRQGVLTIDGVAEEEPAEITQG